MAVKKSLVCELPEHAAAVASGPPGVGRRGQVRRRGLGRRLARRRRRDRRAVARFLARRRRDRRGSPRPSPAGASRTGRWARRRRRAARGAADHEDEEDHRAEDVRHARARSLHGLSLRAARPRGQCEAVAGGDRKRHGAEVDERGSTPNTSRIRRGEDLGGGPSATIRPWSMTTSRGKKWAARPRSWRTATIVVPSRSLRSTQQLHRLDLVAEVEVDGRLVEEQDRRRLGDGQGERTSWRSPERELAGVAAEQMARRRPGRSPPRRRPGRPAAGRGTDPRAAAGRARRPPRRASRTAARPAAGRPRAGGRSPPGRARPTASPPSSDAAGASAERPRERPQQRRLAGAVRPDEGDPLARRRSSSDTSRRTSRRRGSRRVTPSSIEHGAVTARTPSGPGAAGRGRTARR